MADLRWGEDVPADVSDARRRLLDAAEECFAHYGVAKTTVEDVAAKAKVSRATVYRYFDGRDDLLLGVLLREAGRFLGRLDKQLDKERDFATAKKEERAVADADPFDAARSECRADESRAHASEQRVLGDFVGERAVGGLQRRDQTIDQRTRMVGNGRQEFLAHGPACQRTAGVAAHAIGEHRKSARVVYRAITR